MLPLFKPLFRFRKYLLAGKLLKQMAESYVALVELDPDLPQTFIEGKGKIYLSFFQGYPPKHTKDEIQIAALILSNNGHVIFHDSPDYYKRALELTQAGKSAHRDGFYTTEAIKSGLAFFIAAGAAIGGIALLLANLKAILNLI